MFQARYPKIVRREPGSGTLVGAGDTLIDSNGNRWRQLMPGECETMTQTTCGIVGRIYPDGTIR